MDGSPVPVSDAGAQSVSCRVLVPCAVVETDTMSPKPCSMPSRSRASREDDRFMASKAGPVPGSPAWWACRTPTPEYRRGRPPMDAGRIVEEALKLIDEVGIQALTLRMLAEALDSGTATLYRHFTGKDELLALVADRILGEVQVQPEELAGLSWREAATVAATTFYGVLGRHPN